MLVNNFLRKLQRTAVNRKPLVDLEDQKTNIFASKNCKDIVKYTLGYVGDSYGLDLNNACIILWSFINILQTISMVFISSIMLAFPET